MFMSHICLLPLAIAVITRASSQTTSAPEVIGTCNSCCQGPIGPQGNPGIPGVGIHGSHGLPGSTGPKGDPGLSIKGELGERGPRGESGEKGERGDSGSRGFPGKVGPAGERGLVGERGLAGLKGDRGLDGTKGDSGNRGNKGDQGVNAVTRQSAFTVVKTSTQTSAGVIIFENVITNIGNDFDTNTNKFTCRVPGVYVFMFNINADHDSENTLVYLKKNDQNIVGAIRDHQTDYNSQDHGVSGSAVLSLVTGDQVWVQLSSGDADNHASGTNFSGYLLYEN